MCESQKSLGKRTRMVLRARPEEMTTPTGMVVVVVWWGELNWPAASLRRTESLAQPESRVTSWPRYLIQDFDLTVNR